MRIFRSSTRFRFRGVPAYLVAALLGAVLGVSYLALASAAAAQDPDLLDQGFGEWDVTEPRGETRHIAFDVEEGTWMSLDVAPDGEWLVFELFWNLYRLPMEGGEAELLTGDSGIATNFHPAISPDGERIAFISDRGGPENLWVMDSDGSDPRPVADIHDARLAQPAWTPDGEHIVVDQSGEGSGLVKYHLEGGEGVALVDDQVSGETWPSPSQDGRHMYFQGSPGSGDALDGDFQLHRYDFETGQIIDLTSGTNAWSAASRLTSGGAYAPEVSPDGRWLAFARQIMDGTVDFRGHEFGPRSALWLRDLETGEERKIMDPIGFEREGNRGNSILPLYSWTPDGESIVTFQGGKIRRVDVASGDVSTIPFQARVERTISERASDYQFRITDEPFQPRFLRWHTRSPDGTRLAFQAAGKIWVQDLPDGEPEPLTPEDFDYAEFAPSWSPDGNAIAFTTLSSSNQGHVWRAAPEAGATPERLTEREAFYTNTVWTPEGDEVVATRGGGATARGRTVTHNTFFDLVEVPAEGGPAEKITRVANPTGVGLRPYTRRAITHASFGPNGRLFFPTPYEDEDDDLVTALASVDRDGGDRRVHMTFPYADEAVPSPDGRHVAFQEGDNIYLTRMPRAGVQPLEMDKRDPALPMERLSHAGGLFVRWLDEETLEYGTANMHFVHHVAEETTDTTTVEFAIDRDIPEGRIALTGARILTMNEREVIDEGDLVVDGARIVCVAPAGQCDIDDVDEVMEAQGKTVMPGIIDMHAHHYRENRGHRPPNDYEVAMYLAYGVTANLDNSMWAQNIFPVAERIRAGEFVGPRTYSTGDPLYSGDGARHNRMRTYEDAWNDVERLVNWGAVAIKQYSQPRRDQRQWVIDAGREMGIMVTGHWSHGVIMDGHTGWEHALDFKPIYEDVARFYGEAEAVYSPTWRHTRDGPEEIEKFFAERDVWLDDKQRTWMPWRMLTFLRRRPLNPDTDYSYSIVAQAAADIVEHGGYAAIGGHGEHHGLAPHWEIWMAASAFGNMGALEVGTLQGAQFLGADEDLGSLEEGKLADLLVLDSNPLEDIRNTLDIEYVMQGGHLYEADHLDKVWPQEKPFGEKYWVDEDNLVRDVLPTDRWDR